MDIKDRIKLIMEKEGLPYSIFSEQIGVQQSTLSHIINGRNKPSLDVVMKIHQRYPNIDLEWLIYGKENTAVIEDFSRVNKDTNDYPSLFTQNTAINPIESTSGSEYRRETGLESTQNTSKDPIRQEIKYIERPSRKITEIRIYFDDNTYETFKNQK